MVFKFVNKSRNIYALIIYVKTMNAVKIGLFDEVFGNYSFTFMSITCCVNNVITLSTI